MLSTGFNPWLSTMFYTSTPKVRKYKRLQAFVKTPYATYVVIFLHIIYNDTSVKRSKIRC